ncbi:hypothetical protein PFICI_11046 [Pestalotiopsis fici W106-1]|uniref:Oxidoreductase FAD/NAD(P)-binding domain-containing protein n=1 Tax=Pestalotiopsis fici (strain W106-1 / CGMCC3.15140) TaxID=1229662 RepID=W3WVL0_PESFW|nr:uncharacterized protein PFICI_11046 [Pestalotiopsis fici W106-1]ETS77172.1 hypothetical protein PFICI_11046 [Pestalotiopsis fici W106-1]
MASSIPPKTSHLERTAAEPRNQFSAGQWLDVFCPGIPRAGGFTITSPPSLAAATAQSPGYLELAVQKSPGNPPAAWLWQDPSSSLLDQHLQVRVGGSFVWPPPALLSTTDNENDAATTTKPETRRVVLVAGGVGINPLMSMLSAMAEKENQDGSVDFQVQMLYSMKDPGPGRRHATKLLFLERIAEIFASGRVQGKLQLYLTGAEGDGSVAWRGGEIAFRGRRITKEDLRQAVGEDPVERKSTVAYVCGVPNMTDEFVKELSSEDGLGMGPERVLCEKWW